MYLTFQYLTVSCILAIGYVPNISILDIDSSRHFVACIQYKVPDIHCGWHFMVLWLGNIAMYIFFWQKFLVAN